MKTAKPKAKAEKIDRGWFTRVGLAAVLDVEAGQIDRKYRPMLPQGAERLVKGRPCFHARSLINAMVDRAAHEATAATMDPLMDAPAGGSPALERYRTARAIDAELDLAHRQGETFTVSEFEPVMHHYCSIIRQAGSTLQKIYGPDAADILNSSLTEACEAVGKFIDDLRAKGRPVAPAADGKERQEDEVEPQQQPKPRKSKHAKK